MGSVVGGLAFVASSFSNSVTMLMITYGVVGGIGFGLIYLPAIVSVGYYFEKKRAFATGIAVCGSGFGTFVFAPIANLLLENFDWKGANLILAGLIFNCAVSAFFLVFHRNLRNKIRDVLKTVQVKIFLRTSVKDWRIWLVFHDSANESTTKSRTLRSPWCANDTLNVVFPSLSRFSELWCVRWLHPRNSASLCCSGWLKIKLCKWNAAHWWVPHISWCNYLMERTKKGLKYQSTSILAFIRVSIWMR